MLTGSLVRPVSQSGSQKSTASAGVGAVLHQQVNHIDDLTGAAQRLHQISCCVICGGKVPGSDDKPRLTIVDLGISQEVPAYIGVDPSTVRLHLAVGRATDVRCEAFLSVKVGQGYLETGRGKDELVVRQLEHLIPTWKGRVDKPNTPSGAQCIHAYQYLKRIVQCSRKARDMLSKIGLAMY